MTETNVEITDVLIHMREVIGNQAQEIATLRAIITKLNSRILDLEASKEKN